MMSRGASRGLWAAVVPCLLLAPSAPAEESGARRIELATQAAQKWSYVLPAERWTSVGDEIPIAHDGQSGFQVEVRGPLKIAVDCDGDGRPETIVAGVKGFATLRGKDADGEPFTYPVRFANDGSGWKFSAGGFARGSVGGQPVVVIDQNNNGRYDDYGADALVIGSGEAASFLSKVIHVGGELYHFDIDPAGRHASVTPFEGPTGVIDAEKAFKSFGNLVAAVVTCDSMSFNVADARGGMKVPAGTYKLAAGYAVRGTESVWIKSGRMPSIEVESGGKVEMAWGGPVVAEADVTRSGETIVVSANVKFYGQAGEEYHTFKPNAKSPKIIVVEKSTRRELTSGRFGGC